MDGEERVKAAVEHIVKTLGTNNESLTEDMLDIFSKYDVRFNNLKKNNEQLPDEFSSALLEAEDVILRWDNRGGSMVWASEEDAANYLHAVDEVQNILDSLSLAESKAGVDRAQSLLEKCMVRLEEEFRCLLTANSEPLDRDWLLTTFSLSMAASSGREYSDSGREYSENPGNSSGREYSEDHGGSSHRSGDQTGDQPDDEAEDDSDEDDEDVPVAQPVTDLNPLVDLLEDDVVKDLRDIAKRMIHAGYIYRRQCCQAYSTIRKMVMDQSLQRLGMERLSFEEMQKMQWELLQGKTKRWIQVMDVGVKVVVASERQLCDQVFEDFPDIDEACFADVAKATMMQLLGFGQAIATGNRATDKLIPLLDMYEKLRDVVPEIHSVFSGEACLSVREEASGVLLRLGQAARGTVTEFENDIYRDASKNAVPGGALHPLTRFVMNFLRLLLVYVDTLEQLYIETTEFPEDIHYGYPSTSNSSNFEGAVSPVAKRFVVIIHNLKCNLDVKGKLYKDLALTNLFLMNNLRYIVQKVRNTEEIRALLGDEWIRKHSIQVRQHATNYQRSAWVKVLAFLKDEGIRASGSFSSGVSKAVLKERFKSFNAAFDDIHKTQCGWCVPDEQLASELRISITEKLLPAYRAFLGRYRIYLDGERHPEKYIKYTPEELETLISDLFGGTRS